MRASGLLALTIPRVHGGHGADWATLYRVVRILAREDSAVAHVFAFHHLQLATVRLYGDAQQRDRVLSEAASQRLFWGNAFNRLDTRTTATRVAGGWQIDGTKLYCSGSVGSDRIMLTAWEEGGRAFVVGSVHTDATGLTVQEDWDAFGQRQTDSGTVRFDKVFLADDDVLQAPGAAVSAFVTLRPQISQLIMVNLYLGLAEGALHSARRFQVEQARPWFASGVDTSVDDPYIQSISPCRGRSAPRSGSIPCMRARCSMPITPASTTLRSASPSTSPCASCAPSGASRTTAARASS